MRMLLISWALAFGILAGCAVAERKVAAEASSTGPAVVAFLSDFSLRDDAVGQCKAVMLGLEPRLRIVDITHQVVPYSIADGARFLVNTAPYFPKGTVFITVVDPGVGSERRAMVAKSKRGHFYVLPDNGLITHVLDEDGLEGAHEIKEKSWMIADHVSSTFHGRDIFAPVAARIAKGEDWTKVGPVIADPIRLPIRKAELGPNGVTAEVIGLDGDYGNLITNVKDELFEKLGYTLGDTVTVHVGGKEIRLKYVRFFSFVPVGEPLLYRDSQKRLAFAVNQGNFSKKYRLKTGASLFFPRKAGG